RLGEQGLDVTIADISAPGLAMARMEADAAGVCITTLETDLALDPFPPGPWDLIVSVCFLQRSLFAAYPGALAAGGALAIGPPPQRKLDGPDKTRAGFL